MPDPLVINMVESASQEWSLVELTTAAGLERTRLAEVLGQLVSIESCWNAGMVALRTGLQVGSIAIGQLRVNVRPKLAAGEMATLIRYALGGPVSGSHRSQIATANVGLDELLCSVFADELTRIRRVGLSRQYVNRCQSLPVLRGRPDFIASFPWNERGQSTVTCRYHELTCDNLDNQIVRTALERATLMDATVNTRRRLMEHRQAWAELASLRPVCREDFQVARTRYTRLTEHYRLCHNLAELIIFGQRPSAVFESAQNVSGGLSVDMAWLFELFVGRLLNEQLRPEGLTVRVQETDGHAIVDREGFRYRSVRPDVVIYRGDVPIAVIDAKYKELWPATDGGLPTRKIDSGDLYQLFFYTQRLQLRHKLADAPPALIVCPLPAADERTLPVIGGRFTRVTWKAGSDTPCSVTLVLLPLTDMLRRMAAGVPDTKDLISLLGPVTGSGRYGA